MHLSPEEYTNIRSLLINPRPIDSHGRILSDCPCHESASKISLDLHKEKGLICWAGCKPTEIIARLKELGGISPAKKLAPVIIFPETPCAIFQYCDLQGNVIAEKGRFEASGTKTFRWRLAGSKAWDGLAKGGLKLEDLPLFGTELFIDLPTDKPIFFVEGEKATLACRAQGLLAICHGGGAGTKTFGAELDILYGFDVILWPDNCPDGRDFMRRIRDALIPLAKSLRVICPPVPEKGDAWDYFFAGGKVDDLFSGFLSASQINWIEEDHYHISLPSECGFRVRFDFEKIIRTKTGIETDLVAGPLMPSGNIAQPLIQTINIMSQSARQQVERACNQLFGKQYNWTRLINDAFALVRLSFLGQDHSQNLNEPSESFDQKFIIDPILPYDSHTLFFGDGHSGKSFLALSLALSISEGAKWLDYKCQKINVIYIDYEDTKETQKRRLHRLCGALNHPIPSITYYPARGIPLYDLVESLREIIKKKNIALIIVDSVAAACGGKPEDAETTQRYFNSLDKLGITSLSIAHIAKTTESTVYPFGSVMWHNRARRTWYIQKQVEEEYPETLEIGMYCRKVNDGPKPRPLSVNIQFNDPNGTIALSPSSFAEAPELNALISTQSQIFALLKNPMTAREIAESLLINPRTIKQCLNRHPKLFVRIPTDKGGKGRGHEDLWGKISK